MAEKILVVDDEKEIADLVEYYLLNEGFSVDKFYDSAKAWEVAKDKEYDLGILDIMMPQIDGMEFCKRIREKYNYPVIMLTAKVGEMDKIEGLTIGADDYITKPFYPLEMIARVKAQLRRYNRYNNGKKKNIIQCGSIVVDTTQMKVFLNEQALMLTPTEYEIVKILCEADGEAVNSEELFHRIWQDSYYDSNNTITVHIRHIREKMGDNKYIKTIWGRGYKIEK